MPRNPNDPIEMHLTSMDRKVQVGSMELVRCPLCKKKPNVSPHISIFGISNVTTVHCDQIDHKLFVTGDTMEEAILMWNNRWRLIGNFNE